MREVQQRGGAGDKGRDIVVWLDPPSATPRRSQIYQCKHYSAALGPGPASGEIAKLLYYTQTGDMPVPELYSFVTHILIGPGQRHRSCENTLHREAGRQFVSYDCNYRPSLWMAEGGRTAAQDINRKIAPYVDVMIGNADDFSASFDLDGGVGEPGGPMRSTSFVRMAKQATGTFPNLRVLATTLRDARTSNVNDWAGLLWSEGQVFKSAVRNDLEIFDRVGGGDAFASGLIYALLHELGPQAAVDYGAAHGALVMTTPGDTSMASRAEVVTCP